MHEELTIIKEAGIQFAPRTQSLEVSLHLADTSLIMSQRLAEWCAHGPILEQDIAITNITLDLLGQARLFYQYAAAILNEKNGNATATEDTLAYFRQEREFTNPLLTELPNGDWGQTVLRAFFFSVYLKLLYTEIEKGKDEQLAAIAVKSLKEISYHIKWSSEWVIRLGDGTDESHARMEKALEDLWMYTGELFLREAWEPYDVSSFKQPWLEAVAPVLQEATLSVPEHVFMQSGGKKGIHTEHMGYILAEMQHLQRTIPGQEW